MEQVQFYDLPFSSGASGTTTVYIGGRDQQMVYLSAVVSNFASSPIEITLESTHDTAVSARTSYYLDYVCPQAAIVKVTAATGGMYEMPFGGASPYVRLSFDTAATGSGGQITFVYPRIAH